MDMTEKELKRLYFENILWVLFAGLAFLNIYGDYDEISFLKNHDVNTKKEANKIFEITLTLTFFIYVYFFTRNYNQLKKASMEQKRLYTIKLAGSTFLIIGIICLIYFQKKQSSFIGSPAL